jgi:hypothetical protein
MASILIVDDEASIRVLLRRMTVEKICRLVR